MKLEPAGTDRWTLVVAADWPGFAGHFPDNPLLPAAELIALVMEAVDFAAVDVVQSRFLHPVRPGDTLVLERQGTRFRYHRGDTLVADLQWAHNDSSRR